MEKSVISQTKLDQLQQRMKELGISEDAIEEKFIHGSGKGGQKVNKSSTCVHLKHVPTGAEVKCQKERSRALNRFFARRLLCDRVEEQNGEGKSRKQQEIERIRRQKNKRSRRARNKAGKISSTESMASSTVDCHDPSEDNRLK